MHGQKDIINILHSRCVKSSSKIRFCNLKRVAFWTWPQHSKFKLLCEVNIRDCNMRDALEMLLKLQRQYKWGTSHPIEKGASPVYPPFLIT